MQTVKLTAEIRELTGKKVRKLRKAGVLPIGVYGKGIKSEALAVPVKEFMAVYDKAGETGLVELKYGNKTEHVLIKNVQIHPVTRRPLHAELQAVKLTEKIKAKVPVELTGESPAVVNNVGVLIQTLNEVEVEALPTELPEKLTMDVAELTEVGQHLMVKDLGKVKGVEVLTGGEEVVVNVAEAVAEETKKELAAEEAAKAAESAAGAAASESGAGATGEEKAQTEEGEKTPEA